MKGDKVRIDKPVRGDELVAVIVAGVQRHFRTFGGDTKADGLNPLTQWSEGKPATFALGVSVEDVVRFVVNRVPR